MSIRPGDILRTRGRWIGSTRIEPEETPLDRALREGLFSIVVIGAPMGIGDKPKLYKSPRKPKPPRRPGS